MRKLLLLLAAVSLGQAAFASQVRVDTLQGSRTVKQDFVEMFAQPSVMWSGEFGDQVLYENATGGFLLSNDNESKYGLYFGYNPLVTKLWAQFGSPFDNAPYTKFDNPLNFFYGRDMGGIKWALNLFYANSKSESNNYEKNASGLSLGVNGEGWRADVSVGLAARIKNTSNNQEVKGKGNYRAQVEYDILDDLRLFVDVSNAEVEGVTTNSTSLTQSQHVLGIERRLNKNDNTFFYGVAYSQKKTTGTNITSETSTLPVYFGFEAEALSWLVLRGSISQAVLLGTTKLGNFTDTLVGSPTYAAGAGLKLGSFLVDGRVSFGTAWNNSNPPTDPKLDSSNLMTQVAVTYNF
ncbi:MAG: hypothetical protein NZ480_09190 [Bdellovibrionaceae bacterium]|nr:hypothetical protein [Pseudobdellovibrionaceae bacterium]